jgi:vacuolar-type H+-ATPase subunit F/Vma7
MTTGTTASPTVGGIVVIGAPAQVREYAMAGATVIEADDADSVVAAWHSLPADTALVVLTADAAQALSHLVADWPLVAVMSP